MRMVMIRNQNRVANERRGIYPIQYLMLFVLLLANEGEEGEVEYTISVVR